MLTAESLSHLRTRYKFLELAAIEADPRAERVTELLTVQAIARYVHEALVAKEESSSPQTAPGLSPA